MYRRAELVMGRPLELLCLYFFACEQRYMRSATPTLVPLYAAATLLQSPDPHAVTAPSVTLGTLGPHPAASEGAWAPYAAVVAERRRSALRFSDFWMARAPFSTQAVERRCA